MTDWSSALASAFQQHIEISGSSGSAGSHGRKDTLSSGIRGRNAVVLIASEAESAHHSRSPEDHCNHHAFGDGSQPERTRR